MEEGYRIRIYPDKSQEATCWNHIGACRYVWNYMLNLQEQRFQNGEKHLSQYNMIRYLTQLKNDGEHTWMYEISNTSLQRVCTDLDYAYKRFFKKTGHHLPKKKTRKKSKKSFPVCCEKFYFIDDKYVQIQKLGHVRYRTDREIPIGIHKCKFENVRISNDEGKWFLSFSLERESQAPELTDKVMGIDLGVKELAVVAFGDDKIVYHNINKSKKMRKLEEKQKRIQRGISRKYEANRTGKVYHKTNNIIREEDKLRKVCRKMSNIRKNYIHQTTHELATMLPKKVVMEDLKVMEMVKNKHLAKAISQENFSEFIRQMKYKCEWNGIEFQQVDRYYPSSKTCSRCGNIKKDLKLSDRTYCCDVCGLIIDRDYNAAINLSRHVA